MKKKINLVLVILYSAFGLNTGLFAQWNPLCPENVNMGNRGVYFLDDTVGFVVGGMHDSINSTSWAYVLRTENGGQTWDTTITCQGAFYCVSFPCRDTGYAAGNNGIIYKTINGGDTWNNIPQPFGTVYTWMSAYFVNNNVGYFCCANMCPPMILKTTDGGQSWSDLDSTANNLGAWDITFPSPSFGIANNGFTTQDAGHSWNLSNIPSTRTYNSVNFSNAADIYLVGFGNNGPNGNYGSIAKSSDGGQTWANQDYFNTHMLYDIDFSSPNIGYAVGDATLYDQIDILATRDGGLTWWPQQVNYSVYAPMFTSVSAPSDSVAYAIGSRGDIYKTTNGGGQLLGINETQTTKNFVNVYPNPAAENSTFTFQFLGQTENREIIIIDQFGREILRTETDNDSLEISAANFATGLFYYQIVTETGKTATGKLVIE